MSYKTRGFAALAVATTTAAGLVVTGIGAAAGASHPTHAKQAATPTITVTAAKGSFKVSVPKKLPAGTVDIVSTGTTKGAAFSIASLKSGYSLADLKKDYIASNQNSKSALKALNHLVDNTTFYGGLDATKSQSLSGTVVLPKPGTYYLASEAKKLKHVTKLTVTGKASKGSPVTSSATVKAKSGDRFGGDTSLPASGTITFKNVSKGSTASPHFLVLQHVSDGTTKKEIEAYFASGSNQPPSFIQTGGSTTDVISPGHQMTETYDLPAGTYAELCFFPDLKTGMPHAFMGMIKIVSLG